MEKLSAVFWDVDGTLADTELSGHRVAFNLAFRDLDIDWHWKEQEYLDLLSIGGGLNRILYYRDKKSKDVSNDICMNIQKRKRFHYNELVNSGKILLRQGVLRLINELANNNIEQCIVTTSGFQSLEPFLNTSLLEHKKYFSKIITNEDVSNHKPYPDAYQLALSLTKNSYNKCIALEDSEIGIKAANGANLKSLLILPPWFSSSYVITKNANACVDRLGEVNNPANLIYGKTLNNGIVDLNYLTSLIN